MNCDLPSTVERTPFATVRERGARRRFAIVDRAFSLIEILVVMGLLTIIILGLMAMFNQTQRAFRLGMTQTDVLESGRIATDMLVRELEQMTASDLSWGNVNCTNFYATIINAGPTPYATPTTYTPFLQTFPGGLYARTNVLEDLFFLTRENQTWTGIGYFVRTNADFTGGWEPVGTLYRFEMKESVMQFPYPPTLQASMLHDFKNPPLPGMQISKILDGVIHFRVRAYDTNGYWINPRIPNGVANNVLFNFTMGPYPTIPDEANYCFATNGLPAFVEVEIGILEPHVLEKYRSIPVYAEQLRYLSNQAAHVHVFRQRIAIRNVDPSAYQ